ncbi:SWR1-complex protein 4 [[Candida] jaroonii]|uniref:SWR1-complex protein 4 n=1 Tax=[Candida] jaroonii TaxID=467808 RepID=A0ACA9Y939_9ASCO|nr:SWR1-complex protein 4 [[Candida] jaroonii]
MSANDVLDVLNIQRDTSGQPAKKKAKTSNDGTTGLRQSGMARELYNLLGPNTPPVNLQNTANNTGIKDKWKTKATPWTLQEFRPTAEPGKEEGVKLYHWVRGAKELLQQESLKQPYFFKKFNTNVDIPELVDEKTYDKFMVEIKEHVKEEKKIQRQKEKQLEKERKAKEKKEKQRQERLEKEKLKAKEAKEGKKKEVKEEEEEDEQDEKEDDEEEEDEEEDDDDEEIEDNEPEWTYEETAYLFDLCKAFELKWHIIHDRYHHENERSQEDLKEQFYRICKYIYANDTNGNPTLIEGLGAFSKIKETERKQYLERLLRRTPAEIAEEESLVIEARRFELAAKKMLVERSNLLTLLDYPQSSQSVSQYQSSQGIANLYSNLMIMDKNQKKRQQSTAVDPIPPPIPLAASSSSRKERSFQTHLQQYLTGLVKQNQQQNGKHEMSAVQALLTKRLSVKDEEAYGLHYHNNEKLTPGVVLRSSQRLHGLQQRQSVLKSVNTILEELDMATAAGTSWKPVMPTRKTMAKYDELLRSVITLLDLKRGRDKLESEIQLIRSQKGLE